MAMSTDEEFFALLEKSKLLSDEQLAEAREAVAPGDDPRSAAKTLIARGLLTRWQAGQLLARRSSFFLGKYKLIDLLGRGGMGRVFLGQHVTMNRRVALKTISREVGKDPGSLARFLDEARAVANLDHPNIVQAYNVDNEGERYYLVMEYVDGQDLQQLVEAEGPLEFTRAADYIRQAADGLAHAHSKKMIHCDIKPSNLLVNKQGAVKILDLGIARLVGREEDEADHDEDKILGSVDYLSPEQAMNAPDLDGRADIYSLGCTFYFLLTGRPPFLADTLAERIVKHQTQPPPSIPELRPDTPPELADICLKAMAKAPEDRFQTAAEMSRDLAAWCATGRRLKRATPLGAEPEESGDDVFNAISAQPARPSPRTSAVRKQPPPVRKGAASRWTAFAAAYLATPKQKILAGVGSGVAALLLICAVTLPFVVGSHKPPADDKSGTEVAAQTENKAEKKPDAKEKETKAPEESKKPASEEPKKPPTEEPKKTEPPKPSETPKTEPPKPAETTEANKPPEKPKPTPPKPKPKPKPAEKPKTEKPKPPEPPKKVDPLRALAAAVDLPPIDGGGALELGKIELKPDAALDLKLAANENPGKGIPKFTLAAGEEADKKNVWLVRAAEIRGAGQNAQTVEADVAKVWLDADTLRFQWLDDAAKAKVQFLRTSGLAVSLGDESRFVPLMQPKHVEPLVLDILSGTSAVPLEMESLPDPATLQLQVFRIDQPLTKTLPESLVCEGIPIAKKRPSAGGHKPVAPPKTEPGNIITAKNHLEIAINREGGKNPTPTIKLRILLQVKPRVAVELFGGFQMPDKSEWPLTRGMVQRAQAECKRLHDLAKAYEKDRTRGAAAKEQLKTLDETLKYLAGLSEAMDLMAGKTKVQYRVFVAAGDHQVDLFRSMEPGKAAAEKAAEAKAAEKPAKAPAGKGKGGKGKAAKKPAPPPAEKKEEKEEK